MLLENGCYPEDSRVLLEAQTLADAGYCVTVISPTAPTHRQLRQTIGPVKVYRYPRPVEIPSALGYAWEFSYSILMQFTLACYVFLRHGFDAVHMHTPPDFNAVIPIFFKLLGKKFVYDLHDLSPELFQAQRNGNGSQRIHRLLLTFEKLASATATRLIATNETQRQIHIQRCGAKPENCHVVRNGPNRAFLEQVAPLPELHSPGLITIGYVGVIGIQDGVDYLIRSLHELYAARKRRDFRAIVVGDGAALPRIKSLTQELGMLQHVLFTGLIPFSSVPRYIASFDICATPDPSNPYNDSCTTIKTMEYMALGKPIVCFETSENQKTAGEAALYATNNSIFEYAERLEALMNDPQLREHLGKLARSRIENGLTWFHQSQELIYAYDSMFGLQRTLTSNNVAVPALTADQ